MPMALKALGYRLLVKPDNFNSEHKVEGTDIVLEIAHNEKEKKATMTTGVIMDIGPLAWADYNKNMEKNIPWAKVGDHVMYSRYGGKRIEDPETLEEVILLDDGDVLCKIEENS